MSTLSVGGTPGNKTKTSLAKEKLIAYNLEDCAALEPVTRAVAQACRQDIRPSSEAPQSLEIVVADNLIESVLVAEIQEFH